MLFKELSPDTAVWFKWWSQPRKPEWDSLLSAGFLEDFLELFACGIWFSRWVTRSIVLEAY